MQMDINGFGLEQEAFGFGDSYQQMSRSNTEFLNFGSDESRRAKRIREDYFKRIDALPANDQAGRNALFAELEAKLAEINAPSADIANVQAARNKSQRGEKIVGGLQTALNIFNRTTEALGMGKSVQGEQGGGGGGNGGGGSTTGSQMPTWVWIAGGAVVLGLGIFAIYKFRK
jgi:hypothetical protein